MGGMRGSKLGQGAQETTPPQYYNFVRTHQIEKLAVFCVRVHGEECLRTIEGGTKAFLNQNSQHPLPGFPSFSLHASAWVFPSRPEAGKLFGNEWDCETC